MALVLHCSFAKGEASQYLIIIHLQVLNGCLPLVIAALIGVSYPVNWDQSWVLTLTSYFTSPAQRNTHLLRYYLTPFVLYTILYSILPHKVGVDTILGVICLGIAVSLSRSSCLDTRSCCWCRHNYSIS